MNNKKKFKRAIMITFGLLMALIIVFVGVIYVELSPITDTDEPVVFVIGESDNLSTITQRLEDEKIIKNDLAAKIYGKIFKLEGAIKGRYVINRNWSTDKILREFTTVGKAVENDVMITFREGMWAKEFAQKIGASTNVSADELLALWNDEAYIRELMVDYPFLTEDVLNSQLTVKLEGYLFPETYSFYVDTNADAITRIILNQTNVIYNKYKADFDSSPYTIHEIFTLASITQFESGVFEVDQIIAGVWTNRLQNNMPLQSSVTVCYSIYNYKSWEECEAAENLVIDSPYNTYKYSGIPIGPVSNPGEKALQATLQPVDTEYFYFIADVYGDNTVYFAKTMEEHQANVDKYLK